MYTIAFDETSNFEPLINQEQKDEPVMLTGIVFHDTSETKYKKDGNVIDAERERILQYYKAVCNSAGAGFPADLHCNHAKTNRKKVGDTKKAVGETLGEFLKFGTYNNKELLFTDGNNNILENDTTGLKPLKREGYYQIVTVLKTSDGSHESMENALQRDDIASNLYTNMAQEYIKKGIFYNLSISEEKPKVVFNLPSRKLQKTIVNGQENYNKFGYGTYVQPANKKSANKKSANNNKEEKDKQYFIIADAGYYRSMIDGFCKLIKDIKYIDIDESFTKSISYAPNQKPNQLLKQAFLYLSDSVSSVLSFNNEKPFDQDVRKRMNSLNYPAKNMFFYYEGTDDYYDKAAHALIHKDIFTALSEVYDGRRWSLPEVKRYYRKKWYSFLEKSVFEALEPGNLKQTIDALDKYRYSDNLEQGKLLYMLEIAEEAAKNAEKKNLCIDNRYRFKLADIGISAYTHTGNPQRAEEYYHECMKYQEDMDSDDVQRIQIRYITTLNDLFAYERARDHALGLLGIDLTAQPVVIEKRKKFIQRVIDWLLNKGTEKKNSVSSNLAQDQIIGLLPEKVSRPNMYKALSSLGQTYAFMKNPLAEYCFKKSINDIRYAPDSSITKSFLLHWYIDNGDEENYRINAVDYFDGRVKLIDQLIYLINEGSKKLDESPRFSLGYAMFVYIKAFYTFYKDEPENKDVAEKLIHLKETINGMIPDGDRFMKNHPWEIIFKYAAMLGSNTDDGFRIRIENKRYAKEAIGSQAEDIIHKIMEYGDIEILAQELTGEHKIRNYYKKIDVLWSELFLKNIFPHRDSLNIAVEEKLEDLSHLFTFMYH